MIETPADLRAAMQVLGLNQHGLARELRMGKNGRQSVGRWIKDGNTVPGPVQVAVELLLDRAQYIEPPRPSNAQLRKLVDGMRMGKKRMVE